MDFFPEHRNSIGEVARLLPSSKSIHIKIKGSLLRGIDRSKHYHDLIPLFYSTLHPKQYPFSLSPFCCFPNKVNYSISLPPFQVVASKL